MQFEIDDRTAPNVAANWYGIALADALLGEYDAAGKALASARSAFDARERREDDPATNRRASTSGRRHRAPRGRPTTRCGSRRSRSAPASHAAIVAHLQALIAARRFGEAQAQARAQAKADPEQPDWWDYLAKASDGKGDLLARRRALAELALDGAWPSAIRQLKEARDAKDVSFYEQSMIGARLLEFEARYKEEREDGRTAAGSGRYSGSAAAADQLPLSAVLRACCAGLAT